MTAAPERAASVGWCVHGCGWHGAGALQYTREVGSGAGPAYVDHAACKRRPVGYRGSCVHCNDAITDRTADVVTLGGALAHGICERAWQRREARRSKSR